jgi:hypothetical protein
LKVFGRREETLWDEIIGLGKEIFTVVDSVIVYENSVIFCGIGYAVVVDDGEFAVT